jgi:hypothetical protein
MTTRPFPRVLSVLLVAGLFAAAVPASPAEASRPVCRTSKTAKIPLEFNSDPTLRGKGCVKNGVLTLELRQRNLRLLAYDDVALSLYVKVHSTSSNGRFLNQIVHSDEIWLGDALQVFSEGVGRRGVVYAPVAKIPDVTLPELPAGIYQVSFEIAMRPGSGYDREALPSGVASTKPAYIKFKI